MTPKHRPKGPECDLEEYHTPCPSGYVSWHLWAEEMSKTHTQRRCPGCNRWMIWYPRGGTGMPPKPSKEDIARAERVVADNAWCMRWVGEAPPGLPLCQCGSDLCAMIVIANLLDYVREGNGDA